MSLKIVLIELITDKLGMKFGVWTYKFTIGARVKGQGANFQSRYVMDFWLLTSKGFGHRCRRRRRLLSNRQSNRQRCPSPKCTIIDEIVGANDTAQCVGDANPITSTIRSWVNRPRDATNTGCGHGSLGLVHNSIVSSISIITLLIEGIKVTRVEVKDCILPQSLQRAMAAEAEASREAKAKVSIKGVLKASISHLQLGTWQ